VLFTICVVREMAFASHLKLLAHALATCKAFGQCLRFSLKPRSLENPSYTVRAATWRNMLVLIHGGYKSLPNGLRTRYQPERNEKYIILLMAASRNIRTHSQAQVFSSEP